MMEVPKVEETLRSQVDERVDLRRMSGRVCIYYPEVGCSAPTSRYKICGGCPRCGITSQRGVVRALFDHIKALAIAWFGPENAQISQ